ncbi:FMN-dependent NADH-azoreductase [Spirosoma flavum]|uniref:FMN dependent NADH:quinone oxidoreductase n=1 Tax=Spirosoma flavum TaxID=2048557 RepID=A0ABW6AJJ4_9BACT
MNILHVISSPRSESYSIRLGNGIIEKLQMANPGSTVQVRNVAIHPFPHLEEVHIQSFHTSPESRTPKQRMAVQHSDMVIRELQAADTIVIGAPLYNFGIPSTLKAWIDHVVRARVTFRYTASGMEGLLTGKKVYLAVSSGGIYSEGPWADKDFVVPYLKAVLAGIGLTNVTVLRVEGTSMPGVQDQALSKALSCISL